MMFRRSEQGAGRQAGNVRRPAAPSLGRSCAVPAHASLCQPSTASVRPAVSRRMCPPPAQPLAVRPAIRPAVDASPATFRRNRAISAACALAPRRRCQRPPAARRACNGVAGRLGASGQPCQPVPATDGRPMEGKREPAGTNTLVPGGAGAGRHSLRVATGSVADSAPDWQAARTRPCQPKKVCHAPHPFSLGSPYATPRGRTRRKNLSPTPTPDFQKGGTAKKCDVDFWSPPRKERSMRRQGDYDAGKANGRART